MKKYKLIKEYPGSPKLKDNVLLNENGFDGNMTTWCNPLNYPEFWQEVVEKDYEILSFQRIDTKGISYLKDDNYYHHESNDGTKWLIEELLDCKMCIIHSVKRLSDGEIFTIDDNTKYGCVDKFYIKNDYLLATTVLESNGRYLKDLQKLKQPLFTTEDGVDIFDLNADNFWYLKKRTFYLYEKKSTKVSTFIYEPEIELYFSTKEKAEEYILYNKPYLSLNDILYSHTVTKPISTVIYEKLEKLVKQKQLNNY